MLNVWRGFKECRHPSKKCLPRPSIYPSLIRHVTRAVPLRRLSHTDPDSFPSTWCTPRFCSWSALHMLTDVSCHRLGWGRIPADRSGRLRTLSGSWETNSTQAAVTWPSLRTSARRNAERSSCLPVSACCVAVACCGISDRVLSAVSVYQHRSESLRRAWNWPAASGTSLHI